MSDKTEPPDNAHDRAIEALPWLLNGTLDEAERRRVDAHLRQCDPCSKLLERERALAGQMRRGPAISHAPHESLAKLKARIGRDTMPAKRATLRERLAGFATSPPWLYGAIAAQALMIAVLLLGPSMPGDAPKQYQTMSNSEASFATVPRLQVQFVDSATLADVRASLALINGSIASGPSVAGVFVVTLRDSESAGDPQALAKAAAVLQQQPAVRVVAVQPSAEPAR